MTPSNIRIAAFGFRSLPPESGSAGADKFALELYTRLAAKGYPIVVYTRVYGHSPRKREPYAGVNIVELKTLQFSGFDTLVHSMKATWHIIVHDTANVVHIHNGGNSLWALPLRLFGKKVFISQDGLDWKRDKWPWYAKAFLYVSGFISAYAADNMIFDNIRAQEYYSEKFCKKFRYIPYGSEVVVPEKPTGILDKLQLVSGEYFLFVGRLIPDKGVHYLLQAFDRLATTKKMVIIGGSPIPSVYENELRSTRDKRVLFAGYIYGEATIELMKNAYLYIQPSDVEGQSPVVLTVMGLGTPLLCSDIMENLFVVQNTALTFARGSVASLNKQMEYALLHPVEIRKLSELGKDHVLANFNWDKTADEHVTAFLNDE